MLGLALALIPAALLATWRHQQLSVWATCALVALAFGASRITFMGVPRQPARYTPGCLVVVTAGLLGGPVVGVLAGLAAAHRYPDRRANVFWSSEAAVVGCTAGLIGVSSLPLAARVVLGLAAVQLITMAALIAVFRVRRIVASERFLRAHAEALSIEFLAASPLLVVLLKSYPGNDVLVLLTIGCLLGMLSLVERGRERYLREIDTERARARTDALTGLLNRRGSEEAFAQEHARIQRGGTTAGLLLLDFDRFHWINRTYDMAGGDRVLRELSHRLESELRTSDVVGRWGGEELIVIAPNLEPAAIGVLAEKVRRLIRDTPVTIGDANVVVTCSVGATMIDAASPTEVSLQRANRALTQAKEERDTVRVDSAHQASAGTVRETQVDALTGLLNRQAFAQLVLPREIERALQTGQPLALLMIDLDNLKALNDLFGHTAGDLVIAGVGDTIATIISRDELVFRVGGDAFAVILPLPLREAHATAESILSAIARRPFTSEHVMPSSLAHVSASIGIAELNGADEAAEARLIAQALITSAENAMLEAKQGGGGRTTIQHQGVMVQANRRSAP
jgi:diguanylate cyclase (GGDEF)-like protein